MGDDLPGVAVGLVDDGGGHAGLVGGEEGGEPLAVDVHAVLDRVVLVQRQREAVADHLRRHETKNCACVVSYFGENGFEHK